MKVPDSLDTRLNRDNYGVMVARDAAGMDFLPHYGYPGRYQYDDSGVSSTYFHRGTPRHHCIICFRPSHPTNTLLNSTVLIVYLNWVNPVVYQVQRAFVTPLTLGISSLGVIYQMILTLDAYRIKNHIQIFVQCAANVCLAISSVMQYNELKDSTAQLITDEDQYHTPLVKVDWPFWKKVSPGLMVCTIQTCICSLVMCGLAPGLYREFSWALYQHVSPDKKIQNKYFVYQVSYRNPFCCAWLLVLTENPH